MKKLIETYYKIEEALIKLIPIKSEVHKHLVLHALAGILIATVVTFGLNLVGVNMYHATAFAGGAAGLIGFGKEVLDAYTKKGSVDLRMAMATGMAGIASAAVYYTVLH